jgi:cytochrome c-type biogenesis protein
MVRILRAIGKINLPVIKYQIGGRYMEWYFQVQQFLSVFSGPLTNLYFSQQTPFIGAILLGLIGAFAPCQISANAGAISFTTNRIAQGKEWVKDLIYFFSGKTIVYVILGLFAIWIGNQVGHWTIPMFQVVRKVVGPFFLITGLYLVGMIKIKGLVTERLLKYRGRIEMLSGHKRSFLLGILLSLAFCPTMFLLFFSTLIPLSISTNGYGVTLPLLFSLGTFIPVLLFMGISFGFGFDGKLIKKSKKLGRFIQKCSGFILIFLGINDIFLYWLL